MKSSAPFSDISRTPPLGVKTLKLYVCALRTLAVCLNSGIAIWSRNTG